MDETYIRSSLRDRILNDLRNIVKQIYHESVNDELSPENKIYICVTLVKNLDEALRHGLKQLHLGYWKPIRKIIHPDSLQSIEKLKTYETTTDCDNLIKGRTWIALSLRDDSFNSYIQCLINETNLEKYYDHWSILRTNDACNKFLSILSGLNNVTFTFDIGYIGESPKNCKFFVKNINEEKKFNPFNFCESENNLTSTGSSTSLTSPEDSGIHTQYSTSDMEQLLDDKQMEIDFLNGNIPETVLLRKRKKKDTKRHVSFHEDIISKSPEKCRKLKWDSENLRYSWGGEQLDSTILKEVDFNNIKRQNNKNSTPIKTDILDIKERGAPEGEETPSNTECLNQNKKSQKSIIVKRFLQSINKQSKIRQLCQKYNNTDQKFKNFKVDLNLLSEINSEIDKELINKPKTIISKNEVQLNESIVKEMIRNQCIYKTYRLRDYLFIITNANIYLINKNLETVRISFNNLKKVLLYPDYHVFIIYESDEEFHVLVTGEADLTNEVLGRVEISMRRNQFDPPEFVILEHDDLVFLKRTLVEKLAIGKKEKLVYCGTIWLDRENDLLSSVLPTTKRGFLMYKDPRAGDSWIPGDFCLKNGILYLFEEISKFPQLAINIATGCKSCNRTQNTDRPHTFQLSLVEKELELYSESSHIYGVSIRKKNSKLNKTGLLSGIRQKVNKLLSFGGSKDSACVLEFAAANEYELSEWLHMIIQASCADPCEEAHKENIIEGALWVTTDSLIITNEFFWPQSTIEITSCAQCRDIAGFRIGESEKDCFIVIEFICMEANSTSGDWIIYMNSRHELEKFTSTLQKLWKSNEKFPFEYLKEERLVSRCRKSQDNLIDNYWTQLLE